MKKGTFLDAEIEGKVEVNQKFLFTSLSSGFTHKSKAVWAKKFQVQLTPWHQRSDQYQRLKSNGLTESYMPKTSVSL